MPPEILYMLSYKEFEEAVRQINTDSEQWQHILAAIPHTHRQRYIDTLKAGWDMPEAFDIVLTSTHIDNDAYTVMLANHTRKPDAG